MDTSNIGLLLEYEEILLGNRKEFSSTYIGKQSSQNNIIPLFLYAFESLLGWNKSDISKFISFPLIEKLRLIRPYNRLYFPPELNQKSDAFYLASILYPDEIHYSKTEMTLQVYEKVLNSSISRYPKRFFSGGDGSLNAAVCLQYYINQHLFLPSEKDVFKKFSNDKWANEFLKEAKLLSYCNDNFESPLDFLYDTYENIKYADLYYEKGRFERSLRKVMK